MKPLLMNFVEIGCADQSYKKFTRSEKSRLTALAVQYPTISV